MRDILVRVFGPDVDPSSPLPQLPYGYQTPICHDHAWMQCILHDILFWECSCGATCMDQPHDEEEGT